MVDMTYFLICLFMELAMCFMFGVSVAKDVYEGRVRRRENKTMVSDIFATAERQRVLDCSGIKYKIDSDFNFVFETRAIYEKALSLLVKALAV